MEGTQIVFIGGVAILLAGGFYELVWKNRSKLVMAQEEEVVDTTVYTILCEGEQVCTCFVGFPAIQEQLDKFKDIYQEFCNNTARPDMWNRKLNALEIVVATEDSGYYGYPKEGN